MREIRIDREAVFSDGTGNFRSPAFCDAGSRVRIALRTAKGNVITARLILRAGGDARTEERPAQPRVIFMDYERSDALFDLFTCEVEVGAEPVRYHFLLASTDGSDLCCYGRRGVFERSRGADPCCAEDAGQDLEIIPGLSVPEWAQGRVFYQIFVDRFANGDPDNDVLPYEYPYIDGIWANAPGAHDTCTFAGGDLQGVINKLDYLKGLGIGGIYLNPVFVSPSSHKYDTQDYDAVDPHFGRIVRDEGPLPLSVAGEPSGGALARYRCRRTVPENLEASNGLLAELIREAHARGIRVILDGVFNHCGSFHKWMDREGIYAGEEPPGAYGHPESPYRDHFRFAEDAAEDDAGPPFEGEYEGWWGYETLPKLNYEGSPALREEILRIAKKWLSPPYDADGWRLDVAADLGHSPEFNASFWRSFRAAVKSVSPEKLLIAEHYGPAADRLRGDQWDGLMNYDGFMEPVSWFLTGMDKHSDTKREELEGDADALFAGLLGPMDEVQAGPVSVMMNQLSNHDHSRFMTRTNGVCGRVEDLGPEAASENIRPWVYMQGLMIQMVWPGMPAVYYGDEAGMCGFTDPDDRRPYPWGREDRELIEFHRYMIGLRGNSRALRLGSTAVLASEPGLAAFGRFTAEEAYAVAVCTGEARDVTLPVRVLGAAESCTCERLMLTAPGGYNVGHVYETVTDGKLTFPMEKGSAVLWRIRI